MIMTTDIDMTVKASDCCLVIRARSEIVNSYITASFMLYGYLISIISNAKIGPQFHFKLNVKSLYNRQESLLYKLPTDEKGGQTYPIFGKNIMLYKL